MKPYKNETPQDTTDRQFAALEATIRELSRKEREGRELLEDIELHLTREIIEGWDCLCSGEDFPKRIAALLKDHAEGGRMM